VVYATLIWSSREVEVGLMFAGQLACEAFNFALKRYIKEERPRRIHGKGYGMPSSHAQFAFFWAVSLTLFLIVRHRPSHTSRRALPTRQGGEARKKANQAGGIGSLVAEVERYAHQPWSLAERILLSVAALVVASMVAWSRVYLAYHTPKQVLAGCLAGTVSAVVWFGFTYILRQTGLLAFALELPFVRWFRVRDLVVEEDLCQAGWEKWVDRKEASQREKSK
jgi:dolichyldiphosphatase